VKKWKKNVVNQYPHFFIFALLTKAIELPSGKDLRNFCRRRTKFLKEEMKQHPLKSKVPAIAWLLSLRTKLSAP